MKKTTPHSKTQEFGLQGERYAIDYIRQCGFYACYHGNNIFSNYDIIIENVLPVEVKISNPKPRYVKRDYYYSSFRFDLTRTNDDNCLVVLICDDTIFKYVYLIPGWVLWKRTIVSISHPLKYKGYLSRYLFYNRSIDNALHYAIKYSGQLALDL